MPGWQRNPACYFGSYSLVVPLHRYLLKQFGPQNVFPNSIHWNHKDPKHGPKRANRGCQFVNWVATKRLDFRRHSHQLRVSMQVSSADTTLALGSHSLVVVGCRSWHRPAAADREQNAIIELPETARRTLSP